MTDKDITDIVNKMKIMLPSPGKNHIVFISSQSLTLEEADRVGWLLNEDERFRGIQIIVVDSADLSKTIQVVELPQPKQNG